MFDPHRSESDPQALRLKRFLLASATYACGFALLGLCTFLGLFPADGLIVVGAAFVLVNIVFCGVMQSGLNLRFADPSLTQAQVCVAVALVALILMLGAQIHFLAVPFYSVLFVFAMLRLKPGELVGTEAFVLATYCAAIFARIWLYGDTLDLRIEALQTALVVLCSIWFAVAAGVISGLRARLRESARTIGELAIRDGLTGTWNRRHIDALLDAELQRHSRTGGRFCACMIDVDHFKSINDRFGHLRGDDVLTSIAESLQAQLRSTDQLGRFGGEEFLILLPETSLGYAATCAERLRGAVAGLSVLAGQADRVTVSIGLAEREAGEPAQDLLARVDAALYRAKREGRNRVAIDAPLDPMRTERSAAVAQHAPAGL